MKVWRCVREICRAPRYERRDSLIFLSVHLQTRIKTHRQVEEFHQVCATESKGFACLEYIFYILQQQGIMRFPEHLALEGQHIRLLPLETSHADILFEKIQIGSLNTSPVLSLPQTIEQMHTYIATALQWRKDGTAFPFVTVDKQSGEIIGSTRFANFASEHQRVEIGWTWLTVPFQRTFANSEAKYLMLKYAFEEMDLIRVELKANALNDKSRRAMERLGAQYEGLLRQHFRLSNGIVRDTVYYSILKSEWADVKQRLETTMKYHSSAQ
jgi:N-acetyltransferase